MKNIQNFINFQVPCFPSWFFWFCDVDPCILDCKRKNAQTELTFPTMIEMVFFYCNYLKLSQVVKIEEWDAEKIKKGWILRTDCERQKESHVSYITTLKSIEKMKKWNTEINSNRWNEDWRSNIIVVSTCLVIRRLHSNRENYL